MFMPISKPLLLAAACISLASCGRSDDEASKEVEAATDQEAAFDGKIECALAGSVAFARTCTTERIAGADGQLLVIRHVDGGFRRFRILTDGRGLAPADGFDETRIDVLDGGMIEVSSGDDKYRLPAQIKGVEAVSGKDGG
ncbi:MAG: hypothetical protein ABI668_03700 [Sphingorhabdus sp.]